MLLFWDGVDGVAVLDVVDVVDDAVLCVVVDGVAGAIDAACAVPMAPIASRLDSVAGEVTDNKRFKVAADGERVFLRVRRSVDRSVTLRNIHALYFAVYCVSNNQTVCSESPR